MSGEFVVLINNCKKEKKKKYKNKPEAGRLMACKCLHFSLVNLNVVLNSKNVSAS